ncbi:MAG: hypothetical protein AB1846_10985 [Chloroflexota bacterium]
MTQRIKAFAILTAPGGLLALFFLLRQPSEADAAIFLGLSIQRLALVFAALVLTLALLFLAWKADKFAGWAERHTRQLDIFFGILLGIGWLAVWTPSYRLGALSGYFERVYPLLAWTLWLAAVAIALRVADRGLHWDALKAQWREHPALWRAAAIALGIFLLLWAWIAVSGVGVKRDIDMWNEAGVPVLGLQVLFGLGLAGLVLFWERRLNGQPAHRRFDAGIFILIWLAAAIVWQQEPLLRSYFLPRPLPPNLEYYPFSDAALYDFGGQQVLLGNGINNGIFTDKPMYMLLLAVFHALGGQSYNGAILVQVLFVAFYPAVLYLIGKNLSGRPVGVMMAVLAVFKEKNAITAALDIQVVHSKLMMTEMPTALAVSVFVLLAVLWFKRSRDGLTLPLWAGAALGFAALIRPTPVMAAPFIGFMALFLYRRLPREYLRTVAVFGLGVALLMGPWFSFTQVETGENYLFQKIQQVFKRFRITLPSGETWLDGNIPLAAAAKPDLMPLPPGLSVETIDFQIENPNMATLVPAHFWHNQITSVVILPMTFQFHDLEHVISQPAWQLGWEGELAPENVFFILLNLSVMALGMGVAWNKARWAGLLPLVVNVSYNLASAFARTSGSRYIVPVDWVLFLYFSLGMVQLVGWAATLVGWQLAATPQVSDGDPFRPAKKWHFPLAAACMLLIGLSLPFNSLVVPQKYTQPSSQAVINAIESRGLAATLAENGINLNRVGNLAAKDKREVLIHGQAYFPRFYATQQGGCQLCFMMDDAYLQKDFSRLAFTVIGPKNGAITLALDNSPAEFPNAAEVFVYGCKTANRQKYNMLVVDAIFVVVVSDNGNLLYLSQDFSGKLNCTQK